MKIIKLEIADFKRIKLVTIEPKGAAVVSIRGKNGAGKSSCLDAVAALFGGEKMCPREPVRRGSQGAVVRAELDEDFVVERTWEANGTSTLTLKDKEGRPYNRPQKRLDEVIGRLTFDPLAFMRLPAKDQAETLRKLSGVDFGPLNARREQLYSERTAANRHVAQLQARLTAAPVVDAPDEVQSAAELMEEQRRRTDENTAQERMRMRLDAVRVGFRSRTEEVEQLTAKIAALQKQLEEAQKIREELRQAGAALAAEVKALVPPDMEEIPRQLRQVETVNERVRQRKARAELAKSLDEAKLEAAKLDKGIEAIDSDKAALLAEAKFTIQGLAFTDEGVTFNGLPLEQASQAEQLRISIAIGAALAPRLRAMLVRDGSLLDEDSLALLQGEAERLDLQVFLEQVGPGEGILIVDGQVEGAEAPAEVANG